MGDEGFKRGEQEDGGAVQLADNEVVFTPAPLSATQSFTVPLCVSNGSQWAGNQREGASPRHTCRLCGLKKGVGGEPIKEGSEI